MAQPKVKFRFCALRDGGHSELKIFAYDFQGNSIAIPERYSFNGKYSPESKKPQMYAKQSEVEQGAFRDFDGAMAWCLNLGEKLDKSNVAHWGIADSDFPNMGYKIHRQFDLTEFAKKQNQPYKYCLRLRLTTGKYLEIRTLGLVDSDTGELKEGKNNCLKDIQAYCTRWALYNPVEAAKAMKAMIFGDGVNIYTDTKNYKLWTLDYNFQTHRFSRKGRNEPLSILTFTPQ